MAIRADQIKVGKRYVMRDGMGGSLDPSLQRKLGAKHDSYRHVRMVMNIYEDGRVRWQLWHGFARNFFGICKTKTFASRVVEEWTEDDTPIRGRYP